MTIIDPPIKDSSSFYLNELYLQQNQPASNKDECKIPYDSEQIKEDFVSTSSFTPNDKDLLEPYSIKVQHTTKNTPY